MLLAGLAIWVDIQILTIHFDNIFDEWKCSQGGYGGSNNAYGGQQQPQQQQSVGYGGGGYGSQQGYTQSYQGYESYQQPQDYGQTVIELDTRQYARDNEAL